MESGMSEFLEQISGLLAVTCIAGIIWLGMVYLVAQRAAERRRRKREGLPPLPSFYRQVYDSLRGEAPASQPQPEPQLSEFEVPDLDDLTADLPIPDLDDLVVDDDFPMEATPEETEEEEDPVLDVEFLDDVPPAMIDEGVALQIKAPPMTSDLSYKRGSNELPADAVEMMRVWRDVSDGTLIIGIRDQLFASLNEIPDAALQQRFTKLVQELTEVARMRPAQRPTPRRGTPTPLSELEDFTDVNNLGLADQIELILQARLSRSNEFEGRSIHVRPSVKGGVRIDVDGQFYDAVSDVPDADVRQFIQAAIQEWESRQ
jgi:hypothetical protein